MIKKSPYEVLGLKKDFEFKDIKKAYRQAIRANPPEQNPKEFAVISDAYDTLTNEEYFLNSANNDLYALEIELVVDKEDVKIDNSQHLKKIFEVPFLI
jgi:curved DNA-binding protein CbpA